METKNAVRHYANDAIDISYDASRCIHAAVCVRGLPSVFDPNRRPWILPTPGGADEIAAVIAQCPSGALHYKRLEGGPSEAPQQPMSIVPTAGGPYYVRGLVQLQSADGSTVLEDVRMALCRCGQSQNKPFCDNSHFRESFDDPGVIPESAAPAESR